MAITIEGRIQLKGKTKEELTTENPVLLENEVCIEKDTLRIKIGDGNSTYNALKYVEANQQFLQYITQLDNTFKPGYYCFSGSDIAGLGDHFPLLVLRNDNNDNLKQIAFLDGKVATRAGVEGGNWSAWEIGSTGGITALPAVGSVFRDGFVYYVNPITRLVKTAFFPNDGAKGWVPLNDLCETSNMFGIKRIKESDIIFQSYTDGIWKALGIDDLLLLGAIQNQGTGNSLIADWLNREIGTGVIISITEAGENLLWALNSPDGINCYKLTIDILQGGSGGIFNGDYGIMVGRDYIL